MAEFNDFNLLIGTIINIIVSIVVLVVICLTKPKHPKHYRQRLENVPSDPAQKSSAIDRDRDLDEYWFPFKPYKLSDLIFRAGGDAAFYVTALKYTCLLFLAYLPFAIMLIIVDATDNYDEKYFEENPEELIVDDEMLEWRPGMQQWSIANVTPGSARVWAHWFAAVAWAVLVWLVAFFLTKALQICRKDQANPLAVMQSVMIFKSNKETIEVPGMDGTEWQPKYLTEDEKCSVLGVHVPKAEPKKFTSLIQKREKLLDKLELLDLEKQKTGEEPLRFKITKCKKVEAIPPTKEELTKTEDKLRPKIEEFPKNKSTKVVFATFDNTENVLKWANRVTQDKMGLKLKPCVSPHLVLWNNLHKQGIVNFFIHVVVLIIYWIILFFYSIPIAFLSSLDNLANLPGIGPAFKVLFDLSPKFTNLLNGFMPMIAIIIFNIVLPIICNALTGLEGPFSFGELETRNFRKYWGFQIGALIFINAVFGGGVKSISNVVTDASIDNSLKMVGDIVSPSNAFFMTMLLNAAFMGAWLFLLRPGPLIVGWLKEKHAPNDKYKVAAHTPPVWCYWKTYTFWMVLWTLGCIFSITVPIIPIMAGIYFVMQYLISQYMFTEVWGYQPTGLIDIGHTIIQCMLFMLDVCQLGSIASFSSRESAAAAGSYSFFFFVTIILQIYVYLQVGKSKSLHQTLQPEQDGPVCSKVAPGDATQVDNNSNQDLGQAYKHPYADFTLVTAATPGGGDEV